MKLCTLIKELKKIRGESNNPNIIEVKMADNIPIVRPIFKKGIVYITDIDE
jgi:hypothetical protein